MTSDLDYLAARLHGRRSSMAEGERLDALCHIRSLPDFTRAIFPDRDFRAVGDFQRQLVEDVIRELSSLPTHLTRAQARLVYWMLTRLEVENLKVLLRACITKVPLEEVTEHLVFVPRQTAAQVQALASAGSMVDFARLLKPGPLRKSLERAVKEWGEDARPFFFEASLDRGYLHELLARFSLLSGGDREETGAVLCQEADIFHLMLVLRGKFNYGLTADPLLPLHVPGTRISRSCFAAMLSDSDPWVAVGRVVMRVLDPLPFEGTPGEAASISVAALESLAWRRFLRLANSAFRRSHMGFGAIIGYVAIRRLEVANLITISEGIRTGMTADAIRARMIPRTDLEAAYV